jgi:hypothetical protein
MSKGGSERKMERPGRGKLTVTLPAGLVEQLRTFCNEKGVKPGRVVERALIEYFREGEMCH